MPSLCSPTGAEGFCPSALCGSSAWEQKSYFLQNKSHLESGEAGGGFIQGMVSEVRLPHQGMCS